MTGLRRGRRARRTPRAQTTGLGLRPSAAALAVAGALAVAVAGAVFPRSLKAAQTLPGPTYHQLKAEGHDELASRVSRQLDLRANPDAGDVERLLRRWIDEEGGPDSGYDWLAVTRLWLRADDPGRAAAALERAEGLVPRSQFLLDRARVGFLAGEPGAASRYWEGCEGADEAASIEYWLDIETLATPSEVQSWQAFQSLPVSQRRLCPFLEKFWNRRAAASGLDVAERIELHYERLRFALNHYRRLGKKGPTFSTRLGRPDNAIFDDRGLLYIRMGEPDETASYLAGTRYESNITWAYERPSGTRLYHLSPLRGNDNWWLVENLARVYSCGPADRHPTPCSATQLAFLPGGTLSKLYQSRSGLDVRYQQIAFRAGGVPLLQELAREHEWTWVDGEFAISDVPERPALKAKARMRWELFQFRAPVSRQTTVGLNAVIEAAELAPADTTDGQLLYRVEAVWSVLTEDGSLHRFTTQVEAPADRLLGEDEGIPLRLKAQLPPGRHVSTVALRNLAGGEELAGEHLAIGSFSVDSVTIRRLSGTVPMLSDVVVAADSGGAWTPGGGVFLRPSPAHTTGPDGVAFIYYEAYNLTSGSAYTTRVRLEPLDGGEPFELEYPGETPGGGRVVARGVLRIDLSHTKPGNYRMSISVLDHESGLTTLPNRTEIVVDRSSVEP